MIITHFADLIKRVCLDQTLVVHIAHKYDHGNWQSFSKGYYKIYQFNEKQIKAENIDHPEEHLRIDNEMMKDGFLKVEL